MSPWESLTTTDEAPPWNAPSTAAFASRVISRREAGKSSLPRHTCCSVEIPAIPSMSIETKTFVIPTKLPESRGKDYFAAGAGWTAAVAVPEGTVMVTTPPLGRRIRSAAVPR